jgi:hypothetical protein
LELSGKNLNFHSDPYQISKLKSSSLDPLLHSVIIQPHRKILWARLDRQNQIAIVLPANRGESRPIAPLKNRWVSLPPSPDLRENSSIGGDRRSLARIRLNPPLVREIDRQWEIFLPQDGIGLLIGSTRKTIAFQNDLTNPIDPLIALTLDGIDPLIGLIGSTKKTIAFQNDLTNPIDPLIALTLDGIGLLIGLIDSTKKTIAFLNDLINPSDLLIALTLDGIGLTNLIDRLSGLVQDPSDRTIDLTPDAIDPLSGLKIGRIDLHRRTQSPKTQKSKAPI